MISVNSFGLKRPTLPFFGREFLFAKKFRDCYSSTWGWWPPGVAGFLWGYLVTLKVLRPSFFLAWRKFLGGLNEEGDLNWRVPFDFFMVILWPVFDKSDLAVQKKVSSESSYIYTGSGRFPGPMELLLQQLVRVSKTRWRWFNLNKSMLLQPLIKKLEVLLMINQWTTYCINDNNDEIWMVVLEDFYLTFCKN